MAPGCLWLFVWFHLGAALRASGLLRAPLRACRALRFSTLPQHRMPLAASLLKRLRGQAVRESEAGRSAILARPLCGSDFVLEHAVVYSLGCLLDCGCWLGAAVLRGNVRAVRLELAACLAPAHFRSTACRRPLLW